MHQNIFAMALKHVKLIELNAQIVKETEKEELQLPLAA